ncbi:MAG: 2OG-Fe dioxygenase family protein [Nevskia sp.]|nr:2OG-Fe dioxygenase family protein [Nevskia sp.]
MAAAAMRELLDSCVGLPDWRPFAASWDELHLDRHMADGGRYRRRRHAVFTVAADGRAARQPHQPHYQELAYNPLNGGVPRWFEPVTVDIGASAVLGTILRLCAQVFGALAPAVPSWRTELHQFRIEAHAGVSGLPTPEGPHRDGVDYVLVLLVARHNIEQGTTTVYGLDRAALGSFTLTAPLDAAFVDDARVYHGVTPVQPLEPSRPAYRDVLVATFKAMPA